MVDCGSEVSLIEARLVRILGLVITDNFKKTLRAVNGSKVELEGEALAEVYYGNQENELKITMKLGVIKEFDFSLLLGTDFNKKAGLTIDCKNKSVRFDPIISYAENVESHNLNSNLHAAQTVRI